jgi:hypothetical protein
MYVEIIAFTSDLLIKHNLAQIWYENPFKSHPNLAQNSFNKSHLNITIDNMYVLGIE